MDKNPAQYTFFHFILNNDLSEKDAKLIFDILHALEDKKEGTYQTAEYDAVIASVSMDTLEKALLHVNIDVNPIYLDQYIEVDLCNYLLEH